MFARYTNGKYYRGFVESVTSNTVHIKYDDGSSITLKKSGPLGGNTRQAAVLHCRRAWSACDSLLARDKPDTTLLKSSPKISRGSNACYQEEVYDVVFDDGDQRRENFNEIRLIP